MKKGVIIGIAIAIIIGGSTIAISQTILDDTSEISLDENVENDSDQFTVGLSESIGFTETP